MRVWDSGFGVQGFGFRVLHSGLRTLMQANASRVLHFNANV